MFSLLNATGKNLVVQVSKEGYYAYKRYGLAFDYAGGNQNFAPDINNPFIFRLKKKGVPDSLVRFRKSFTVPKDGSPIEIDLTTGKQAISGSAALKVECWTDDQRKQSSQKFDWKCRVSLIGGGIQLYSDEFPFLAPDGDYKSSDEIDMTVKPDEPWQLDVERHYFVRTADGRFGRVAFRMVAHGDHFCQVESFFNPSGSRNLEFDPNNVIQVGQ